jgi:hypothetical protein
LVVEKNHRRLAEDKTRAILEYIDFHLVEQLATRGILFLSSVGTAGGERPSLRCDLGPPRCDPPNPVPPSAHPRAPRHRQAARTSRR